MSITYGDSGTNRNINSITYGDAGTNRTILEVWVGDGGTNRLIFAAVNLLGLDPSDAQINPTPATAQYRLTSTGLEQATGSSDNTWLLAGSASDYEVRLTVNSGSLSTGSVGVWESLGTTRTWTLTRGSVGTSTADTTVEIRLTAGGAIVATANVIFTAEVGA